MDPQANAILSTWSDVKDHHQPIRLDESVSVGIAAYGNAEATRRCLEALFKSTKGDFELILINDNSPDEGLTSNIFNWASSIHKNTLIYEATDRNIEYSGSVNLLLSHAKGDKIMFISNDIFVTPYYFRAALQASTAASDWGIIRGSSNFVDNGLASHNIKPGKPIENLEDVFTESLNLYSLFADLYAPDPFFTGDAFIVNRQLINRIGSFDPLFYGYFADHDYGLRAQIAGMPILLVPGAYAFHQAGSNISYLNEEAQARKLSLRWARIHENWARFKLKYGISVDVPYTSIHDIAWEALASASFSQENHYIKTKDYGPLLTKPN
jgi:GT2 family glycosyltransferase